MLNPDQLHYLELQDKEIHAFYRETRIFIMKEKLIEGTVYWTCKSCLSYVPSFKQETLEGAKKRIWDMLNEFLARF